MIHYKSFSISRALKYGFSQTFTAAHFWEFFKMTLITFGLYVAAIVLTGATAGYEIFSTHNFAIQSDTSTIVRYKGLSLLGLFWVTLLFFYGYQVLRFSLSIIENKTSEWKGFFDAQPSLFWKYFLARLWFWLKAIGGFILLIIPGVYISIKYVFSGIPILDGSANTVGSDVLYNRELTRGVLWKLLGFGLLIGFIAGLIGGFNSVLVLRFFGPGIPATITNNLVTTLISLLFMPISCLAFVHIYKQLEHFTKENHELR